jgi:phosphoribosylamine--glycine ligase
MGSVLFYTGKSKLADKLLRPIEDALHRTGFIGSIDANTIIDEDGNVWPLEWTMRCGWPALNIEQELIEGDFIEFLAGLAAGSPPKNAHKMDTVAVGIVCALPPFPFPITDYETVVGLPIYGITPALEPHVHLANAQMSGNELLTAGDYVLIGGGIGETVVDARNQALRVLRRISIPTEPYYRQDIGTRLRSQLDALHAHGFAIGVRYA